MFFFCVFKGQTQFEFHPFESVHTESDIAHAQSESVFVPHWPARLPFALRPARHGGVSEPVVQSKDGVRAAWIGHGAGAEEGFRNGGAHQSENGGPHAPIPEPAGEEISVTMLPNLLFLLIFF